MASFKEKIINWLTNIVPSKTFTVSGGGQSLIDKNIPSAVSALKNTSEQPKTQPTTPKPTTPKPKISQPTTPRLSQKPLSLSETMRGISRQMPSAVGMIARRPTTFQGSAFIQPTGVGMGPWEPKVSSLLPQKQTDKEKFIDAIIDVENEPRDPNAINKRGRLPSYGMMQINKQTWEEVDDWRKSKGQKVYPFKTSWMDPDKNIEYGTQYLFEVIPEKELIPYKQPVNLKNVIGSYNAGPTGFRKGNYVLKDFPQVIDYIKKFQKFYE